MNHKRIGHFELSTELVNSEKYHDDVKKIMGECIITKCELVYHNGCFQYFAISEHFDELPEGQEVPLYTVIVNKDREIIFKKM